MVITIPLFGYLSDKLGRKPLLLSSTLAAVFLSYPLFSVVASAPGFATIVLVQSAFGLVMALYSGPGPAAISEIFPTHLRSTWMSIGYTLAVAVFGGFAPFIATYLIQKTGSPVSPAVVFLIPVALLTTCFLVTMPETAKAQLR
jgi:MHS family proline/betaine transporter-like MFS transporter